MLCPSFDLYCISLEVRRVLICSENINAHTKNEKTKSMRYNGIYCNICFTATPSSLKFIEICKPLSESVNQSLTLIIAGPSHCWLNTTPGRDNVFKGDGIFLVVVVGYNGGSFEANQNTAKIIEKAKSLQQRY